MSGDLDPTRSQMMMREAGVTLDSVENGVALSRDFHQRLHTAEYDRFVEMGLSEGATPQARLTFLNALKDMLRKADTVFQMNGQMPVWGE